MWQQWLNFVLGVWLAVSAFVGFTFEAMQTNLAIAGGLVALFALWGAVYHNRHHMNEMSHAHSH